MLRFAFNLIDKNIDFFHVTFNMHFQISLKFEIIKISSISLIWTRIIFLNSFMFSSIEVFFKI
jgi:hypothetical protein